MPAERLTVPGDPGPFSFDPVRTVLLLIDMQRDFVEPGVSARHWATTSPCCEK